jgi:HlyD family secretion protein
VPDLATLRVTARLEEAERGRMQPGQQVIVRADAVPDRELTGTLKDISVVAKPDFTTWPPVRNFDVVVSLSEADPRLRSGMSASARVELDRLPSVLVVPTAAVFQRGPATVVYVVHRGSVESRPVTVLRRGRDQIALASGVSEGERVALKEPEQEGAPK